MVFFHQVPAFETKDGKCIYESNAIAYYGMLTCLIVKLHLSYLVNRLLIWGLKQMKFFFITFGGDRRHWSL